MNLGLCSLQDLITIMFSYTTHITPVQEVYNISVLFNFPGSISESNTQDLYICFKPSAWISNIYVRITAFVLPFQKPHLTKLEITFLDYSYC